MMCGAYRLTRYRHEHNTHPAPQKACFRESAKFVNPRNFQKTNYGGLTRVDVYFQYGLSFHARRLKTECVCVYVTVCLSVCLSVCLFLVSHARPQLRHVASLCPTDGHVGLRYLSPRS